MKTNCLSKTKWKVLCVFFVYLLSVTGMNAQVTIGSGVEAKGGALLDLKEHEPDGDNQTSTKGILYPRVILTNKSELYPMYSATDQNYIDNKATIKAEHTGLTVYNVKENGDFLEGLHVWSGTSWRRMDDSDVLQASIGSLMCSSMTIARNSYSAGIAFETTVTIPYTGGNGASYSGTAASTPVNGLTIERIGGKLAIGGGQVMYKISGTPTVTTPQTTTFNINFLGHDCSVMVGAGTSSLQLRSLSSDVTVNVEQSSTFPSSGTSTNPTSLSFGTITITEEGSYAFTLRLYGRLAGFPSWRPYGDSRWPFYIYLMKNGTTASHIIDAAEIDIVAISDQITGGYNDYSYSVTLGGAFEADDEVYIGMNRGNGGPTWTLRWGDASPTNPVRTSLVYWKL